MNDLNYTALWGFLSVACAALYVIVPKGHIWLSLLDNRTGAFLECYTRPNLVVLSLIFGSLTALTWGG